MTGASSTEASRRLSLETMRDDLARVLGMPAESISDDADLIGLGLDSVRAMRLVAQWRRRGGGVRFADLASATTLAQWWEVVSAASGPAAAGPGPGGPSSARPDRIQRSGGCTTASEAPVDFSARLAAPFPLTPVQHAYWVGRRDDQVLGGVGCHAYLELDTPDTIDPARLEAAGRALVARHEMLRARFLDDGTQSISDQDAWPGVTVHRIGRPDDSLRLRERLSHRLLDASRGELFDLQLSRFEDGGSRLHVEVDFLAADVVGLRILLDDLAALYLRPDQPLAPLRLTFAEYQRRHLERLRIDRDRDHEWWRERTADLPGPPQLPLAVDPARVGRPRFVRRESWLPRSAWDAVTGKARAAGVTPAMVLAAAYGEVLGRWSSQRRFVLNLPVFARDESLHPDVARLVADFTDLLLLPVDLTETAGFGDRARGLQRSFRDAAEHTAYSGVEVLRDLSRYGEAGSGAAVFACNLGNELITDSVRQAFGKPGFMITQTPQVWLDHQINEYPDGLHLALDAVEELFPPGVLDGIFDSYVALLNRLPDSDWGQPVIIELPGGQQRVRAAANATGEPAAGGLLHRAFFEHARTDPDRTAVICGERELSYGDLADQALRIGAALRRRGVRPGDAVAITMPRGAARIAAVLGVLAIGGAYVPVGLDQPPHRRSLVLERAQTLITCAESRTGLLDHESALTTAEALTGQPLPEPVECDPAAVAYVIFTSGSTGEPKGVEVSHRAAWNTIDDVVQRWGVGCADRVLAVSALEFDLSVFDVFGMLGCGGSLVVVSEEDVRDAQAWARLCDRHRVTVWNSVPMLLEMLLAACQQRPLPEDLRLALVSGDWAAVDLPARLRAASDDRCRLQVLGGATEAAIWSNFFPGDRVQPGWPAIPYGRPLRGQRFRVVNDTGEDCPDWVAGELWIGGAGVAVGYRGDEELTADRFVRTGADRWYRTGDRGRYWPDGTLELLGRVDTQVTQVKIRGHRIELGEIEAALESAPQVHQAVVVAPGTRTNRRLVGFIAPASAEPGRVKEHLSRRLAPYAIPALIVPVDEMPLTRNGKIDRAALRRRAEGHAAEPARLPPRGPVEAEVADLWATLLDTPTVLRGDDFFGLGGDSLIATRLIAELRRRHYTGATLSGLFGSPELSEFAALLTPGDGAAEHAGAMAVTSRPEERYEPFPPTEVQRAYLVGRSDRFTLGGVGCHFYTELDGDDIDLNRLTTAWNRLIARHDTLRTVFTEDGMQRVLPKVPRFKIRRLESPEQLREQMADQVLDPTRWPLFDVRACPTDDGTRIGLSFDNVLLDALSLMTLRAELDVLYSDPEAALPPIGITFRDYVTAMRPTPPQLEGARRYWSARLPQLPPAPRLPLAADPADIGKPHFVRREAELDTGTWGGLREAARRSRITPSVALAAAYCEVLAAWSGRPDLTLTMTLFDRREVHPHIDRVLGDFTSLLLAAYHSGPDRRASATALQEDVAEGLDHSEVPAVWALRELARRSAGAATAMPVVFTSMLGVGASGPAAAPFAVETWGISQTPQVWIDCQVGEADGRLLMRWDAVKQLFDPAVLDEMFAAFTARVAATADDDWSRPLDIARPVAGAGPSGRTTAAEPRVEPGRPRPGVERAVSDLWSELLGVEVADRAANFFVLGGDSLAATRLADLAERRLGASLSLREFFAAPTVAGCAQAMTPPQEEDMEEGEL